MAYDLGHLATLQLMGRDLVGARRTLDEQAKILPALGSGRGLEEQSSSRALLAMAESNWNEAQKQLETAVSTCKDPGRCSTFNQEFALLWLMRGDAKRAKPLAEAAYQLAHKMSNPGDYTLPADLRMGEVYAALGQAGKASALFTSTVKRAIP